MLQSEIVLIINGWLITNDSLNSDIIHPSNVGGTHIKTILHYSMI
jgi:hypothetical protein